MASSIKEQQNRDYLRTKVNPILEPLVKQLLKQKPSDVHEFMINYIENNQQNPGQNYGIDQQEYNVGSANPQNYDPEDVPESEPDDEDDEVAPISMEQIKAKSNNRTSVSAEAFGVYHKRSVFNPPVVKKTEEQVDKINKRLENAFMFKFLEESQKKIVIDALSVHNFKNGDWVIKQGEDGDLLYIVDDGTLECYRQMKKDEEPKYLRNYDPGDSFGELALLYNAPRAASIKAVTDCTLFGLDRETFNAIVKDAEVKRREKFEDVLSKIELLSTMDPYERTKLGDVVKVEKYSKGDFVIKEGEEGDIFYMIEEGHAVATKTLQGKSEPEVVYEYKPGDYFGELSLLNGDTRQANIIAQDDLVCLTLDRATFNRILGSLKSLLKRNAAKYEKFM